MTREQLSEVALHLLREITPEAAQRDLAPDEPLTEALGLDSFDFLNFVIALHDTLRIEIPEADYPKLATLRGCVDYLARSQSHRLAGSGR